MELRSDRVFRGEGRQPQDTLNQNEWRDSLVYALVSDEYEAGGDGA